MLLEIEYQDVIPLLNRGVLSSLQETIKEHKSTALEVSKVRNRRFELRPSPQHMVRTMPHAHVKLRAAAAIQLSKCKCKNCVRQEELKNYCIRSKLPISDPHDHERKAKQVQTPFLTTNRGKSQAHGSKNFKQSVPGTSAKSGRAT